VLFSNFTLLKGIGEKTQRYLNRLAIKSWDDFLTRSKIPGFPPSQKAGLDAQILELKRQLKAGRADFFARFLPRSRHWQLFPFFREQAVFLDIETSGCQKESYVTLLGMADRKGYRVFVRGRELTQENLYSALLPYKLVISFYGSVFDLPFLEREFPGLPIYQMPHFDLCLGGKKAGLKGGLKRVEALLGINRPPHIAGIDGYQAVRLWQAYLSGNEAALKTLIEYNREDTLNLIPLSEIIYEKLLNNFSRPAAQLSPGLRPELPMFC